MQKRLSLNQRWHRLSAELDQEEEPPAAAQAFDAGLWSRRKKRKLNLGDPITAAILKPIAQGTLLATSLKFCFLWSSY